MPKNITALDHVRGSVNALGDLRKIQRAFENWHDVVLFRLGLIKRMDLRLRSGEVFRIDSKDDYFNIVLKGKVWATELARQMKLPIAVRNGVIEIKTAGKTVKLRYGSRASLGNVIALAIEQFIENEYGQLDVKNRIVVDIGASVGDSAIYFAMKGATHVYAFEPYPSAYSLAVSNIGLNRLRGRVTMINKGVGGAKARISVDPSYESYPGSKLGDGKRRSGKSVGVADLNSIAKDYRIDNGVLKVDCEGSEYEIIRNASDETLLRFDQIAIEYHYGYIDIETRLRRLGFSVKHTHPLYMGYGGVKDPSMYAGLIFAHR